MRFSSVPPRGGFVLLEALLAVAIFAIGVIGLGRCVTNCILAEQFQAENALASRALENRLAEIESGAVPITHPEVDKLPPPYTSMTLKQTAKPLERKNERDEKLGGLFVVTLEVNWQGRRGPNMRSLTTYVSPRE